jgi:hypothetical protein
MIMGSYSTDLHIVQAIQYDISYGSYNTMYVYCTSQDSWLKTGAFHSRYDTTGIPVGHISFRPGTLFGCPRTGIWNLIGCSSHDGSFVFTSPSQSHNFFKLKMPNYFFSPINLKFPTQRTAIKPRAPPACLLINPDQTVPLDNSTPTFDSEALYLFPRLWMESVWSLKLRSVFIPAWLIDSELLLAISLFFEFVRSVRSGSFWAPYTVVHRSAWRLTRQWHEFAVCRILMIGIGTSTNYM